MTRANKSEKPKPKPKPKPKTACIHCGGLGIMSDTESGGETCFMCNGRGK